MIYLVYVRPDLPPEALQTRLGYIALSLDEAKTYVRTRIETERASRAAYNASPAAELAGKVQIPTPYSDQWKMSDDGYSLDYGRGPEYSIVEHAIGEDLLDNRYRYKSRREIARPAYGDEPNKDDGTLEEIREKVDRARDLLESVREMLEEV